jgi:hypothetical protein
MDIGGKVLGMVGLLKGFRQWLRMRSQEMELRSFAVGMNSTVDATCDKHIICMDFDVDDISVVERSVRECQEFWCLGPAFLYATTHGFHAILFFDIVPYSRARLIIEYARDVDDLFRYISRYYSHKTIRVAGKYKGRDIRFVKMVPGCRYPSVEEREIGMLKYREHCLLTGCEPLRDGVLLEGILRDDVV